jgi:TolA-binding protein
MVLRYITFISAVLFLTVSCSSAPPEIPDGLSQPEFFHKAQEAKDAGKYETALAYYREFITRYPEDIPHITAAEYEIAFIYYEMEDYSTSKRMFEDLINEYSASSQERPERFLILSEKILEKIEQELSTEEE